MQARNWRTCARKFPGAPLQGVAAGRFSVRIITASKERPSSFVSSAEHHNTGGLNCNLHGRCTPETFFFLNLLLELHWEWLCDPQVAWKPAGSNVTARFSRFLVKNSSFPAGVSPFAPPTRRRVLIRECRLHRYQCCFSFYEEN